MARLNTSGHVQPDERNQEQAGDSREQSSSNPFGAIDPISVGGSGDGGNRSNVGGSDEFDPAIHVGRDKRNSDGSYRRKRGRRAGSGSSNRANSKGKTSVNTVESALVGIHAMLSVALRTPELKLEDDESKPLAQAVKAVADLYDIPVISEAAIAWIGLITVGSQIYGPRMYMINERLKAERAEKRGSSSTSTRPNGVDPNPPAFMPDFQALHDVGNTEH